MPRQVQRGQNLVLIFDTAVLLLATLLTIPKFYEADAKAGFLLMPYLGWTCFASTLINCSLKSASPGVSTSHIPALTSLHATLRSPCEYKSKAHNQTHGPSQVVSRAQRMSALKHSNQPTFKEVGINVTPAAAPGAAAAEKGCGLAKPKSILKVDPPIEAVRDPAVSPFSDSAEPAKASPLAQARELLDKVDSFFASCSMRNCTHGSSCKQ